MINITNLSKSFGNKQVLKSINLHLERNGLVVIHGNSGCGKTTFLNVLAGLLPFEGEIQIDGHNLSLMSEKEIDSYRIKNYGFIFQDFKLFENENVINNILFPLEVCFSSSQESKIRKCTDLLKSVGLRTNYKQIVSKLSGGEKQRVAIARALVNNPKIILADEPTGQLDSANANNIMCILKNISKKTLVVVVSHDEDLAKQYADQIIRMKDGQIEGIFNQNIENNTKYIPFPRSYYSEHKPSIPLSFLIKHTINSFKQKKWRASICNMVTSLGLIGVGLASTLSSSISTNIKESYKQIIDDSKIVLSFKDNKQSRYGRCAANYHEVMDIIKTYPDDIYDIGLIYQNDFDNFFPHSNTLCFADTIYYRPIEGISAKHINEFRWLDIDNHPIVYPEEIEHLDNDQIVLSLTINMVQDICFELKIERTVGSLSRYLQLHPIKVYFDLRNDNWEYSDQQLFEVVGFTLEKEPAIYHVNHMWNKHVFEDLMRFPSIENSEEQLDVPWVLQKIYYLQLNDNANEFLLKSRKNRDLNSAIFEIACETHFSNLFREKQSNNSQKLLVFTNYYESIPLSYTEYFEDISPHICDVMYGSIGGYSIYPSNLMFGFSNFMYFSSSHESLDETIDISTSLNLETNENFSLSDDVVLGHFSQSMLGGVNFSVLSDQLITGRSPTSLDEIVISSNLADKLFPNGAVGNQLHVAYLHTQKMNLDGTINKTFKTANVTVTGVVQEKKNLIYHYDYWLINFFQIMLDVSAFNLLVNAIMLDVGDAKNVDSVMKKLERSFPEFEVTNPMSSVTKSVSEVCKYIEVALICFSTIAVVISVLLLTICNYLYVLESRKEIGLVRCLGVNKRESKKLVIAHSVISTFVSFFLSCLELILISFLIGFETSHQLGGNSIFSFNPWSVVYMFLLAFGISLLSSVFVSNQINKLDPISAMKV